MNRSTVFLTIAMIGAAPAAFAQSNTTPPSSSTTPPAIATGNAESKTTAAPVPGKNSFTEAEARKRLDLFGYNNVTDLHQDDQSIWRGTATKNGQQGPIALDYQGNIVTQ